MFSIILRNPGNNQTCYLAFREDKYRLHILSKYRNRRLKTFGDLGENMKKITVRCFHEQFKPVGSTLYAAATSKLTKYCN